MMLMGTYTEIHEVIIGLTSFGIIVLGVVHSIFAKKNEDAEEATNASA